jgi:hypothetical protein
MATHREIQQIKSQIHSCIQAGPGTLQWCVGGPRLTALPRQATSPLSLATTPAAATITDHNGEAVHSLQHSFTTVTNQIERHSLIDVDGCTHLSFEGYSRSPSITAATPHRNTGQQSCEITELRSHNNTTASTTRLSIAGTTPGRDVRQHLGATKPNEWSSTERDTPANEHNMGLDKAKTNANEWLMVLLGGDSCSSFDPDEPSNDDSSDEDEDLVDEVQSLGASIVGRNDRRHSTAQKRLLKLGIPARQASKRIRRSARLHTTPNLPPDPTPHTTPTATTTMALAPSSGDGKKEPIAQHVPLDSC